MNTNIQKRLALIKQAYKITENSTPLYFDCGKLCSALCCKGDITASAHFGGMNLLPGEEELISDCDGFEIKNAQDGNILICDSKCNRQKRPFMCRIFPYYAHISNSHDGQETISILPDPRALNICPLISGKKRKRRKSVYFVKSMTHAIRVLMKDEELRKELIKTSEFCDGLYSFYRKML